MPFVSQLNGMIISVLAQVRDLTMRPRRSAQPDQCGRERLHSCHCLHDEDAAPISDINNDFHRATTN
jgi:hypothetical protein